MSDFREPPQSFKTIGAIRRNIEMPCAIPPLIYMESAIDASIELWRSVTKPVWKQYVKFAFGKSWLKVLKETMSDAEKDLGVLHATRLERLYTAAEFLDKSTFYLWVSEVGADFAYNWASLIHEYTPCSKSPHEQQSSGASMVGGFVPNGAYTVAGDYINTLGSGPGLITASLTVPPGKKGEMLFAVHWPPTHNATYQARARIRNARTGAIVTEVLSGTTTHTSGTDTICYSPNLEPTGGPTEFLGEVALDTISGTFLIAFPTSGHVSTRFLNTLPLHTPREEKPHPPRLPHPAKQHSKPLPKPATARPKKHQPSRTQTMKVGVGPQPIHRGKDGQLHTGSNAKKTRKR